MFTLSLRVRVRVRVFADGFLIFIIILSSCIGMDWSRKLQSSR